MTAPINVADIPAELTALPQFVTWKYNAKKRKLPCAVNTGKVADAHTPSSWGTFEAAVAAFQKRRHAGIGFDFTPDDPYTGIDLDDCIAEDGTVKPIAAEIIAAMHTYTERSPSGRGVKMWVRGRVPDSVTSTPIGDGIKAEIYSEGRFFTMTGNRLEGTPAEIRDVGLELDALYERVRPPRPAQPQQPRTAPHATADADHARRYALAALEAEHQAILAVGDGERHNTRLRAAFALAGYIPHITEDEITAALAVNFGADEASARKTIADGIAAGKAAPRPIPEPRGTHASGEAFTIDESTPEGAAREIERLRQELEQTREQLAIFKADHHRTRVIVANPILGDREKVGLIALTDVIDVRLQLANAQRPTASVHISGAQAGHAIGQRSDSTGRRVINALGEHGILAVDKIPTELPDGTTVEMFQLAPGPAYDDLVGVVPITARKGGQRPGAGRKPKCAKCPPGTHVIKKTTVIYVCKGCGTDLYEEPPKFKTLTEAEINIDFGEAAGAEHVPSGPERAEAGEHVRDREHLPRTEGAAINIDCRGDPTVGHEAACRSDDTLRLNSLSVTSAVSPNEHPLAPAIPPHIEETFDLTTAIRAADRYSPPNDPERFAFKRALVLLQKHDADGAAAQLPHIKDPQAYAIVAHLAARHAGQAVPT